MTIEDATAAELADLIRRADAAIITLSAELCEMTAVRSRLIEALAARAADGAA